MKKPALAAATLALYVLHQDFWLWSAKQPLLFGVLPPGLAYHAVITVLIALLMLAWVKWAWPHHLQELDDSEDSQR